MMAFDGSGQRLFGKILVMGVLEKYGLHVGHGRSEVNEKFAGSWHRSCKISNLVSAPPHRQALVGTIAGGDKLWRLWIRGQVVVAYLFCSRLGLLL